MILAVKGANINAAVTEGTHFTLKDGQTLKITAPVSMIYKVAEKDYSSEDYTTTVTYESSGTANKKNAADGTLFEEQTDGTKYNCVRGTTETTVNSVLFTNKREAAKPDTGINLDFIPYVLMLVLAAAAGGAVLVYKKKRTVR
jgi:hypothetical protein